MNKAEGIDKSDTGGRNSRACMQRYRARHKRIDYVPSPEVLAIIEAWRARKLDNCIAGVIDRLMLAGHAALSGNADSTRAGRTAAAHPISGKVVQP